MNEQIAVILAPLEKAQITPDKPNALRRVLFEPIICWVIDACRNAGIEKICIATNCREDLIRTISDSSIEIATEENHLGTGCIPKSISGFLSRYEDADVAVLNGDTPFLDPKTIQDALSQHRSDKNAVTAITAYVSDCGHSPLNIDSKIMQSLQPNAESGTAHGPTELPTGNYWFTARDLLSLLSPDSNPCQEMRLSDAAAALLQNGKKAGAYTSANPDIIMRANSSRQLYKINETARMNKLFCLMEEGVEIPCTDGILIEKNVQVGMGTLLLPGTVLRGATVVGEHCTIGPDTLIADSTIGDNTSLNAVQCYRSTVGRDVTAGPFCHIRPNTVIHDGVHIGDFVELKNADIGAQTHIAHLSYVGDSDVGERVNFGCGVAVANYDGVHKYRCTIGNDAFIGCNTNLVAPVNIGSNGYTAAGSTITEDVPDEALAIARAKQVNKPGYNQLLRGKKQG